MNWRRLLIFCLFLTCNSLQANLYLYSENEIPVRTKSNLGAPVTHTIKPGEYFDVIKWNTNVSRVRLSDGTIGFVEKKLISALAPEDETGFLPRPLRLTVTQDETLLIKQGQNIAILEPNNNTNNAEFSSRPQENLTMPADVSEDLADIDDGEEADDSTSEFAEIIPSYPYPDKVNLDHYSRQFEKSTPLTLLTWENAMKRRKVAKFMGGGYRSGNRSKGMCAQAVRESLVGAGVCNDYSSVAKKDAIDLHRAGIFKQYCPKLKLSKSAKQNGKLSTRDIASAPGGSVIVYSGYAGRKKHNYGHVEIKIPVTSDLLKKMGKNGLTVKVGDFLYCSDYCKTTPTKKSTNEIEAIYTM